MQFWHLNILYFDLFAMFSFSSPEQFVILFVKIMISLALAIICLPVFSGLIICFVYIWTVIEK